jgi:acetyltransferase-like isoleucine patch superfamily enzyme
MYLYRVKSFLLKNMLSKELYAKKIGVTYGVGCRFYGDNDFGSEPYLIKMGDKVSLTSVKFITHDGGVWVFRKEFPDIDVIKPIKIGDNVFIGMNSIIMPGVRIGDNVVIGAGSIVTKDIPSNSVCAGVPSRIIRSLDEYKCSVVKVGLKTKYMSSKEKREYLKSVGLIP